MTRNIVCVVQARVGSSRLPGKSLRALAGRPMIEHVIERASRITGVTRVVLATTNLRKDDALASWARASPYDLGIVRGSETDVLSRYATAADEYGADVIIRITGDCPFLAPDVADDVVRIFDENPLRSTYANNDTTCSGYPDGMDVEVFSHELLDVANAAARTPADREHVTRWMRREVCAVMLKSENDWSRFKLSVDTLDDYEYACRVASCLRRGAYGFTETMIAVQEAQELHDLS